LSVWFTSDTHFGHANILKFASRPFLSVQEMDEQMIQSWNSRVAPGDTIYHLGDFAFADHNPYLRRLNGQKRLIRGNHDHHKRLKTATLWATVDDMLMVEVDGVSIVLCHYALRVWNKAHHGSLHFYGHSHGNLAGDSQSCDVGVDCWDFRPVLLDEVRVLLAASRPRVPVDHHR
jgi:calcineurin-like phosphoesterase family protein